MNAASKEWRVLFIYVCTISSLSCTEPLGAKHTEQGWNPCNPSIFKTTECYGNYIFIGHHSSFARRIRSSHPGCGRVPRWLWRQQHKRGDVAYGQTKRMSRLHVGQLARDVQRPETRLEVKLLLLSLGMAARIKNIRNEHKRSIWAHPRTRVGRKCRVSYTSRAAHTEDKGTPSEAQGVH